MHLRCGWRAKLGAGPHGGEQQSGGGKAQQKAGAQAANEKAMCQGERKSHSD